MNVIATGDVDHMVTGTTIRLLTSNAWRGGRRAILGSYNCMKSLSLITDRTPLKMCQFKTVHFGLKTSKLQTFKKVSQFY